MPKKEKGKTDFGISVEEMVKVGLHFGHKSSKIHHDRSGTKAVA